MALNDIDAAVDSFKKALVLEPNDGQLHYLIFLSNAFFFGTKFVCHETDGSLEKLWPIF